MWVLVVLRDPESALKRKISVGESLLMPNRNSPMSISEREFAYGLAGR